MRWREVREGDVLEWQQFEEDVHLVLETAPLDHGDTRFRLFCLITGEELIWHASESGKETLEKALVSVLARS